MSFRVVNELGKDVSGELAEDEVLSFLFTENSAISGGKQYSLQQKVEREDGAIEYKNISLAKFMSVQ